MSYDSVYSVHKLYGRVLVTEIVITRHGIKIYFDYIFEIIALWAYLKQC